MPMAPLAYCSTLGCLVRVRSGACPAHSRHRLLDDRRGSAASRGYDRAWRTFRDRVLKERPACEDCKDQGFVTRSRELHHIVALRSGGVRLDGDNVRALCKSCHSKLTAAGE